MKTGSAVLLLLIILPLAGAASAQETIDVQIKGFDDGERTTQQADYQEAVLFAKREAIERAGVRVKSLTTMEDFQLQSDYIESAAEAVLLPGFTILDIGYQNDGTYLVILTGQVAVQDAPKTAPQAGDQPVAQTLVVEAKPSPLRDSLLSLSESPQAYVFDLGGLLGEHEIEKAYFTQENTFVIHYSWYDGVVVLEDIDKGLMLLTGAYTTSRDKGSVRLDFNNDGTAHGEWRNFLSRGEITIRRR